MLVVMIIDYCNQTERELLGKLFDSHREDIEGVKKLYTYFCPVIIFICFFSFSFNAVLMTISRQSTVVNKSPILLLSLNLALTDLVASLLNGFNILHNSYLPQVFGIMLLDRCSILVIEAIRCAAIVASALHLLALAFVHYRGIVNPLHARSTIFFSQHLSRTINLISIVCWILPVTLLLVWFSSIPCQGFRSADCEIAFLYGFSFRYVILAIFALPLIIMSIIYLRIFIIISHHQKSRRLNHDRSTLSRGVISAAAPMVSAAAVNLPDLINRTGRIRCAACAARALNEDGNSSISDLDPDIESSLRVKRHPDDNNIVKLRSEGSVRYNATHRDWSETEMDQVRLPLKILENPSSENINCDMVNQTRVVGKNRTDKIVIDGSYARDEDRNHSIDNGAPSRGNIIKKGMNNIPIVCTRTFFYLIKRRALYNRSELNSKKGAREPLQELSDGQCEKVKNEPTDRSRRLSPYTDESKNLEEIEAGQALLGLEASDNNDSIKDDEKKAKDVGKSCNEKRDETHDGSADEQSDKLYSYESRQRTRIDIATIKDDEKMINIGSTKKQISVDNQGYRNIKRQVECTCDTETRPQLIKQKNDRRFKLIRSNTIANDKSSEKQTSEKRQSKRILDFHLSKTFMGSKSTEGRKFTLKKKYQNSKPIHRSLSTKTAVSKGNISINASRVPTTVANNSEGQSVIYTSSNNNNDDDYYNANSNDVISTNTTTALTTVTTYEPQRRHVHASAVPPTNTKALITTLLILGTYFTSYVPAIIMQALTCIDYCPYPVYNIPFNDRVKWGTVTTLLLIVKSIVDPFIYTYRMSEIQVAINRYISKKRSKSSFAASMHQTSQRYTTSGGLAANSSANTNFNGGQRQNPPPNTSI